MIFQNLDSVRKQSKMGCICSKKEAEVAQNPIAQRGRLTKTMPKGNWAYNRESVNKTSNFDKDYEVNEEKF